MAVALTVAKWIGIILAVCFLLLLFLCLALLFAPFSYKISCDTTNTKSFLFRIHFLFPLLCAVLCYKDRTPFIRVRVAGIPVYSWRPGEEEQKKGRGKKSKRDKKGRKKGGAGKQKNESDTDAAKGQEKAGNSEKGRGEEENVRAKEDRKEAENLEDSVSRKGIEAENPGKNKLKELYLKIRAFFSKIKKTILNICDIIKKYTDKTDSDREGILEGLKRKKDMLGEFLGTAESKEFLALSRKQFPILLRHIRPKKFKGRLCFGTGDPCTTGQVLAVLAVLLPLYGDSLQISPDFERACFEAEITAKGRIQLFRILLIAKSWYFTQECRKWKRKFNDFRQGWRRSENG